MRAPALAAAALALSACGAALEAAAPPPRSTMTLEQARSFDDFPLYFAGDRVDGLPLVAVLRRDDGADYVSFVYGDCVPAADDQGCAPPAEIQVWSSGSRSVGSYASSAPGAPVPERTTIRSLPAAFFEDGNRLEVYAGRSTIVLFADSPERIRELARELRCVNAAAPSQGILTC